MVSNGYTNVGEEWAQKHTYRQDTIQRDSTLEVLLYDDSTDALGEASDIGDVQTEPGDGNYARELVDLDTADVTLTVVDGDLRASTVVTFDVTDTTGTVDAWAATSSFQSDVVNSESGANEHLVSCALLDAGSRDLANYDELDVEVWVDLG